MWNLIPLNAEEVSSRMPPVPVEDDVNSINNSVSSSVLNFLVDQRYGEHKEATPGRRKKVTVHPGKSICLTDIKNLEESRKNKRKNANENGGALEKKKPKRIENKNPKDQENRKPNSQEINKPKGSGKRNPARKPEEVLGDSASDNLSDFDSDNEASPMESDDDNDFISDIESLYPLGSYVIVDYEGEKFPSKVVNCDCGDNTIEVSTMVMRGMDWAWPNNLDETWYHMNKVLEKIAEPQIKPCFSGRAHRDFCCARDCQVSSTLTVRQYFFVVMCL